MAWEGYQLITFSWVFFAFATMAVFARLYVQLRFRYRPRREAFVVIAWLLYMGSAIIFSLMNDYGNYNHSPDAYISDEEYYKLLRINYAQAFMWMPCLYCCKAALLCFYKDLAPPHVFPSTWRAIVACWVFCAIGCAIQFGRLLFACWPFELNWDPTASCGNRAPLIMTSLAFHAFTDALVYVIPFFLLHKLFTLSWRAKAGAAIMFGVGLFNVIAAILQTAFYAQLFHSAAGLRTVPKWASGYAAAHAWLYTLQQGTSIVIICAPALRRLWNGTSLAAIHREKAAMEARGHGIGDNMASDPETGGISKVDSAVGEINDEKRIDEMVLSNVSSA